MNLTDIDRQVISAIKSRSSRTLVELVSIDHQKMIQRDEDLARSIAAEGATSPFARIWINRECLVASSSQARHSLFPAALALLGRMGWAVAVRKSAGTAVVHRPGVINLSLFLPKNGGVNISSGYEILLSLLIEACADIGVSADMGWVPQSICDGRYNLRHRGRKLAGTAAFVHARGNRQVHVVHASLNISGDIERDLQVIGAFERALGRPEAYAVDAHTSVELAQGGDPGPWREISG